MTTEAPHRERLLRRDTGLSRLVERLLAGGASSQADELLEWATARDAERRSLAREALERYRELNLLYDLAERSASLDSATVIRVATGELSRVVRRGEGVVLLAAEAGQRVVPATASDEQRSPEVPEDGYPIGAGVVGRVAAGADGEIVNDCPADPRATPAEQDLRSMMVAPLRAGGETLGVMMVFARDGAEFTAGEHRMLSAVAALSAPALAAALAHERTLAQARAREAELQRQLDELRSDVEERRRDERVREITGSDYFRSLRQQADVLRRAIDLDTTGSDR